MLNKFQSKNKITKAILSELAPGGGKTMSAIDAINHSPKRYVYVVPTINLLNEIQETLNCYTISTENVNGVVSKFISSNLAEIDSHRVILTTQATFLRNISAFSNNRSLVMDERVSDLIRFSYVKVADNETFQKTLASMKSIKEALKAHYMGTHDLTKPKVQMLETIVRNDKTVIANPYEVVEKGVSVHYYHYIHIEDYEAFKEFNEVILLGAVLKNTFTYHFLSHPDMCGFDVVFENHFNARGNPLDTPVIIKPMFSKNVTRGILEKHAVEALRRIEEDAEEGLLIAMNSRFIKEPTYAKQVPSHFNVISPMCHGLNKYRDRTQVAVLYSNNPDNNSISFMKACGKAMFDNEDMLLDAHMLDNYYDMVFQAVTRIALRDNTEKECIVYVPDMRAVNFLKTHMKNMVVDTSLMIEIEEEQCGAKEGNTNAKGVNYDIRKVLMNSGMSGAQATRRVQDFTMMKGRAPSATNPADIVLMQDKKAFAAAKKEYKRAEKLKVETPVQEEIINEPTFETLEPEDVINEPTFETPVQEDVVLTPTFETPVQEEIINEPTFETLEPDSHKTNVINKT